MIPWIADNDNDSIYSLWVLIRKLSKPSVRISRVPELSETFGIQNKRFRKFNTFHYSAGGQWSHCTRHPDKHFFFSDAPPATCDLSYPLPPPPPPLPMPQITPRLSLRPVGALRSDRTGAWLDGTRSTIIREKITALNRRLLPSSVLSLTRFAFVYFLVIDQTFSVSVFDILFVI